MTRWPDGEPVTPWADPWHDVLADIRQFTKLAGAGLTLGEIQQDMQREDS